MVIPYLYYFQVITSYVSFQGSGNNNILLISIGWTWLYRLLTGSSFGQFFCYVGLYGFKEAKP